MKFKVNRTSLGGEFGYYPIKPLDYAVKVLTTDLTKKRVLELKNSKDKRKPFHWEIEINTLEELLKLQQAYKCPLVVEKNQIQIVDSWYDLG